MDHSPAGWMAVGKPDPTGYPQEIISFMHLTNATPSELSVDAVVEDCLPAIRPMAIGKYGVAIGGSIGKGTCDKHSDLDFRLYCEDMPSPPERWQEARSRFREKERAWKGRGVKIDGCWVRKIGLIDAALSRWLAGEILTEDLTWTIWGYHLLPDLYHQRILEDPWSILAEWKDRLRVYPEALKRSILARHLSSLRYWREDYHYESKVRRGDVVFLAGLSARLVHDMMQVVFALNETYYPGDGSNLEFARTFKLLPTDFAQRIVRVLYPIHSDAVFEDQRRAALDLLADVETLMERAGIESREEGTHR